MNKAFEDRLSERKAFEALLIESAERALRTYARWTSGDENTIAKAALPGLEALKVLVAGELAAASEESGARLRVDVPFTSLVPAGTEAPDEKGSVDIVIYDAASGAPLRLIQLLNAPTQELTKTSMALSVLRSELHPPTPDAHEIVFTSAHADERSANDAAGDIDLTECQGWEVFRVISFCDVEDQTEFFVCMSLWRVYLGEDHGF
jgi:hypothetical protein